MPAPAPPPSSPPTPGPPAWKNVFVFSMAPPTFVVILKGRGAQVFRWRVYGAGIPFYTEGVSSRTAIGVQMATPSIGWTLAFCSVDVLTTDGSTVEAYLNYLPTK